MIFRNSKVFRPLLPVLLLSLPVPAAFARDVQIDTRYNILGSVPADFKPQMPDRPAALKNCRGAVMGSSIITKYSIENAVGDGLTVQGTGAIIKDAQIVGASGNGITLNGTGCIINGGVIDGARGVGILVTGTGNIIKNVTVVNCSQPIVVNGVGNIVDWSTIRTTREAVPPVQAQNIQTYGAMRNQSSYGQLATPQRNVYAQPTQNSTAEVKGTLLRKSVPPLELKAKEQTI